MLKLAKSTIEIHIVDADNNYLQIPVNPESIDVTSPYAVNTVNIVSLGDVGILGERGLRGVSFDSFFPLRYNSSYCEYDGFPSPSEFLRRIEGLRDRRLPVRVIVTGTTINFLSYISDFTYSPEQAGNVGDVFYSLGFVQYKEVTSKIINNPSNTNQNQVVASKEVTPTSRSYVVVRGDNLSLISRKQYGTSSRWNDIYQANLSTIGKNPNLIFPGQRLVLP